MRRLGRRPPGLFPALSPAAPSQALTVVDWVDDPRDTIHLAACAAVIKTCPAQRHTTHKQEGRQNHDDDEQQHGPEAMIMLQEAARFIIGIAR